MNNKQLILELSLFLNKELYKEKIITYKIYKKTEEKLSKKER